MVTSPKKLGGCVSSGGSSTKGDRRDSDAQGLGSLFSATMGESESERISGVLGNGVAIGIALGIAARDRLWLQRRWGRRRHVLRGRPRHRRDDGWRGGPVPRCPPSHRRCRAARCGVVRDVDPAPFRCMRNPAARRGDRPARGLHHHVQHRPSGLRRGPACGPALDGDSARRHAGGRHLGRELHGPARHDVARDRRAAADHRRVDAPSTCKVSSTWAAASRPKGPGAGANPATCSATAAVAGDRRDDDDGGGSGGGGGGGFQGAGGMGGPGDTGGENPGGNGGLMIALPTIVRGGCPGAASGKAGPDGSVTAPSTPSTTAPGGPGGGAIQLSGPSVDHGRGDGAVCSPAARGGKAHLSALGGRWWWWWLRRLHRVRRSATSGSSLTVGWPRTVVARGLERRVRLGRRRLENRRSRRTGQPAAGGAAGSCAKAGAAGAAGATLNGATGGRRASMSCGGAGGGGGAGYILVFASTSPSGTPFSPAPSVVK